MVCGIRIGRGLAATSTRLALAAALAALPLRAAARPQSPAPAAGSAILGILRDESGAMVAAAEVVFRPDATPDLPALRDLAPPLPVLTTTSDRSGAFRLPATRPGLLVATTASGLGAVVERVWPNRAVRVRLRPMAEITFADAAEFTVWPALRAGPDERRHLPMARGRAVRLPAGHYEAWLAEPDGFAWRDVTLQPGERLVLPPLAAARTLTAGAFTAAFPAGFAQVPLTTRDQPTAVLLGDAATADLYGRSAGDGAVRRIGEPSVAADAGTDLQLQIEGATAPAAAWLLTRAGGDAFRVLARAEASAAGAVALPRPTAAGDHWLVVTAEGQAAVAVPRGAWREGPDAQRVAFQPGRTVPCTLTLPDGSPAADVAVTFAAAGDGPTIASAYTNELGSCELGPILGDGVLLVRAFGLRAVEVALAAADRQPVAIRLEAGLAVRGRITLADGAPAANVAVTLRDSLGRSRLPEATVATGADGTFAFTGLEASNSLLLFASQRRDGRTFSAYQRTASGSDDVVLVLRDEDPQIRPPQDR